MSDELKQAGPYSTSWESGYCVLRNANAPEGMRILMMTPDNIEWVASRMNEAYEAARAKDAELIRTLLDTLHAVATLADVDADERATVARPGLEAASAAGFKPSDP